MVNRDRLVNEFTELVKIDSLTKQERKMADALTLKLEGMGYKVYEDDAGKKIGGTAGNLICNVKGEKNVPAIMISAHMDTVVPGIGKQPVVEGDIIKSDGKTVLGGDDMAGAVAILEALRVIKENGISHGDLQIVFTIAEEGGLWGAKHLDYEKIYSKYGFVLDADGPIGGAAILAPSQYHIEAVIRGKAAHAGMEPEKGVSAIQIFADAVTHMKLGRIDFETTANIGIISGGAATNIICDRVEIKAEARSRNAQKLEEQVAHMKDCLDEAAARFGGSVEFSTELMYPSYAIKETDAIAGILRKAAAGAGLELQLQATGGGSDTNVLNGKGIQAVDLSIGMDKVHSVEEQIKISDMVKSAEFLVEIIKAVE